MIATVTNPYLAPRIPTGAYAPRPAVLSLQSYPMPAGGTSDTGLRPEQFAPGSPLADVLALADWLRYEEAVYVDGEWFACEGLTVRRACGREVRQALRRV